MRIIVSVPYPTFGAGAGGLPHPFRAGRGSAWSPRPRSAQSVTDLQEPSGRGVSHTARAWDRRVTRITLRKLEGPETGFRSRIRAHLRSGQHRRHEYVGLVVQIVQPDRGSREQPFDLQPGCDDITIQVEGGERAWRIPAPSSSSSIRGIEGVGPLRISHAKPNPAVWKPDGAWLHG